MRARAIFRVDARCRFAIHRQRMAGVLGVFLSAHKPENHDEPDQTPVRMPYIYHLSLMDHRVVRSQTPVAVRRDGLHMDE